MKRKPNAYIYNLILTLLAMSGFLRVYGLNAAPAAVNFPKGLLTLPDAVLVERADAFNRSEHPDSALLYYMIVAQRELDTRSPESIHTGLRARVKAGSLYYTPFYDYGKAYALFQEAYDLALQHSDHEISGLAANDIGNVLSVYSITEEAIAKSNDNDIIDWYARSVDHYLQGNNGELAIPTINNLLSMAMDTTLLSRIVPLLLDFRHRKMSENVPGREYTNRRIDAYINIRESHFGRASSILRSILSDSLSYGKAPHDEIMINFDLAALYMLEDRPDSALVFVRSVQQLASDYEMMEVIPGAILMEADLYEMKKDSMRRNSALLRYYEAKDSLVRLSSISSYAEPHLRKRIADIDVQLMQVKGERRQALIIIWALVGLMLIAGVFTLLLVRKNRTLDNKNRHLVGQMEVIERQEKLLLEKTVKSPEADPDVLSRIMKVLDTDRSIFDPEFSIDSLAYLCGEKTKTVSSTLNAAFGKNFNTLLNEYRVREMCRILDAPSASSLTIEAVAQQAGYRSRSTYISAFKKLTGLTPSEYIKVKKKITNNNVGNSENVT